MIMMEYLCIIVLCTVLTSLSSVNAWGSGDRVLLEDVKVLTLHTGRMTNAGRSSPIPQLKCTGGNAGCGTFTPQVVQCYNRGSDGYDVQWECKTDMDNAYRFGKVQVSCEGYEYPDDPYILKGSCGLEYTLDLTKEGNQQQGQHNYYGNSGNHHSYEGTRNQWKKESWLGDIILWVVIAGIAYAIYHTCVASNQRDPGTPYPDDGNPPGQGSGARWGGGGGGNPPAPGFRSNYMPGGGGGCAQNFGGAGAAGAGTGMGGGGFWTGAATGGLLGYMFGNRNQGYGYGARPGYRTGYGRPSGGFGSFGGFGGGGFGGGGSRSSGTRTASGFGGTSRR